MELSGELTDEDGRMAYEAFAPSHRMRPAKLREIWSGLDRSNLLSYLFLFLAPALWAGNFIVGRAVHDQVPPLSLNGLRWLTALTILFPLFGRSAWHARKELARNWKSIFLLALTGIVGFNSLLYLGERHTTAISAAMIFSTSPLIILGLSAWLGRSHVSCWQMGAGALSVCGAIVVLGGNIGQLGSVLANIGDFIVLVSCFFWAAYCVLIKTCQIEADAGIILLVTTIVGSIIQAPLSVAELGFLGVPRISVNDFLAVGYLGVGAATLGFLAWQHAVRRLGPARSGVFLNLVPIFGVAMSVGILHEQVLWHHVVGGICVATGIAIAQFGAPRSVAMARREKTPPHWTVVASSGNVILWRETNGNVALCKINGGTPSTRFLGHVPTRWSIVGAGDFNGDGNIDILWRDSTGNVAMWLMNESGQAFSARGFGHVPATWSVAGTGDYNNDGRSDVLWHDASGNIAIWLMNGANISSAMLLENVPSLWSV